MKYESSTGLFCFFLSTGISFRSKCNEEMLMTGYGNVAQNTATYDIGCSWEKLPDNIKFSKTITSPKSHIKEFIKSIPFEYRNY